MVETIIVVSAVALAGIWGVTRITGKLRGRTVASGCGSDCGGCACVAPHTDASLNRSTGLVVLGAKNHGGSRGWDTEIPNP